MGEYVVRAMRRSSARAFYLSTMSTPQRLTLTYTNHDIQHAKIFESMDQADERLRQHWDVTNCSISEDEHTRTYGKNGFRVEITTLARALALSLE